MIPRRGSQIAALLLLVVQMASAQLPDAGGDWRGLSADTIRQAVPTLRDGREIERVPMRLLYTFSSTTFFELGNTLKRTRPEVAPEAIVLSRGTYGLADIELAINDPDVFRRLGDGLYISYRPIFVTPTASLVIRDQELRLSLPDVAALVYRGNLFVVDSVVTTWDERSGDHGPRSPLAEEQLSTFGVQAARPFLLGLRGSRSYFAASHFRGLGYYGRSATFGMALAAQDADASSLDAGLRHILLSLPRPTGILIGNTIEDGFFGVYARSAGPLVLLGNVLKGNVIFNVDVYDETEALVLAHNLITDSGHEEGVRVSRDVNNVQVIGNVSAFNATNGIVLDRLQDGSRIENNISFWNDLDGFAVTDSKGVSVRGNLAFSNARNGLYVHDGRAIHIEDNRLERNGGTGIEFNARHGATEIEDGEEVVKWSRADVIGNAIHRNLEAAMSSNGPIEILIRGNDFSRSTPTVFSGDLSPEAPMIRRDNQAAGYRFRGPAAARGEDPTP